MGAAELLELQRIDDRIEAVRVEAAALEGRRGGTPQLRAAQAAAETARRAAREADARVRALELDAATLRDRVRGLDRQLYGGSVRNPVELVTLSRELDETRARLRAEEDRELEAMEAAETAASAAGAAEQRAAVVEAERSAAAGPEAERLDALRSELADLVAERELVASRRPPAELRLYAQVLARHRPAVVRIAGDACGGCRVPLGLVEARAVRTREGIVQCSRCDRILAP